MSSEALEWLGRWEALVNAGDIEAARPFFAGDVVAFGSLAPAMHGLDALVARQWSQIWPTIRDFALDRETLSVRSVGGGALVVIAGEYRSLGKDGNGGWYDRAGRTTLVLEKRAGGYVCVHSHFSMVPGIPARRV
jgi:ketosteroid isomerase-like protein